MPGRDCDDDDDDDGKVMKDFVSDLSFSPSLRLTVNSRTAGERSGVNDGFVVAVK